MTRDELIKVAAKAYIDDGEHYISDAPRITWLDLPSSQRNEVRKGISAALSAIEAAGYTVVPANMGQASAQTSGDLSSREGALHSGVSADAVKILNLLALDENGHGLLTTEKFCGEDINVCHDPYYEMEGAIYDLEQLGADKICIKTLRCVQKRLAEVSKYARKASSQRQNEEAARAADGEKK